MLGGYTEKTGRIASVLCGVKPRILSGAYPDVREAKSGDIIFRNVRGNALSRDGVAYILRKYSAMAARWAPALRRRKITSHVMRHGCAVALLQSGADVTAIRNYLRHASVATTSRYITTNLQMKREALEMFWRRAGLTPPRLTPWKPKPDLLAFLSSLSSRLCVFISSVPRKIGPQCRRIVFSDRINPVSGYCAKQAICITRAAFVGILRHEQRIEARIAIDLQPAAVVR